jgi:hypothetical protein
MRRSFVTVGFAVLLGASIVQAQSQQSAATPAPQQPAAPAQAAPAADPLKFTTDDAVIVMQVAPGKSADFEAGMGSMLSALNGSAKPELKAFGATMKLFKVSAGTAADQPSLYVLQVTGASKELSYNYGKILYYSGKEPGTAYSGIFEKQEDATAVYSKIKDSVASINPWPLAKIGG